MTTKEEIISLVVCPVSFLLDLWEFGGVPPLAIRLNVPSMQALSHAGEVLDLGKIYRAHYNPAVKSPLQKNNKAKGGIASRGTRQFRFVGLIINPSKHYITTNQKMQ